MHFSYFVQQKLKLASAIAIILVIVLINNRWENNNINELGETFGSVYKDRLVVENYIFKLASATHEKKYLLTQYKVKQSSEIKSEIASINTEIDFLLKDYQTTFLTVGEQEVFKNLLRNNDQLRAIEENPEFEIAHLNTLYDKNIIMLNKLSKIQMKEGEALYKNSRSIVTSNASLSYLELGLLIILGLITQALIFNSKSIRGSLRKDNNNLPLN
ncbi:MCP four helix bundle domain-containing protein [Marivirga sp.]|uniref:MCP four helix bundle domain-containing protein n=1 Tax=Marivirga sp. TaxID=2018662 RepID=UPI002D7FEEFE|nr:MCP four helix bundle domain-containing protein [Marivirga sp.]HET8860257.1 MCP four helix bundle domain-containing protein [Marivirga sp.]